MEPDQVAQQPEYTAYFEPIDAPDGDDTGWEYFQPTIAVISVWSPKLQHGGPPTGLLVRAMENAVDADDGQEFSRVTMEILGAIGLGVNRVRTTIPRPGRQISQVSAELEARQDDGTYRLVARATAWRLKTCDSSSVERLPQPPLDKAPEELKQYVGFPDVDGVAVPWGRVGFIGTATVCSQPSRTGAEGAIWIKPNLPLVAGESTSSLATAFTVIDVANGVGSPLDPMQWSWMNTDTTVHLIRQPVGPWIGIDSNMASGADGYAASFADLYDQNGFIGRSAQTALLARNSLG